MKARDELHTLKGRVVASAEVTQSGNDEAITVTFADGSQLRVTSWDYEGYDSGLYVSVVDEGGEQ